MRIAVIGGGASGLVTAYLLRDAHHVTLLERRRRLGGNIRTLNRNVSCGGIPSDVQVDAGVIEFERERFPAFHALMAELGVELGEVPGTSGLFLADGRAFLSLGNLRRSTPLGWDRIRGVARLIPIARSLRRFLRRSAGVPAALDGVPFSVYLDDDVFSLWARLLAMYAYSIPAPDVGEMPAALAVPTLRSFLGAERWSRVVGGVYVYVERILERFDGDVRLEARVRAVRREYGGVILDMDGGETLGFDAVVFATTPDQVAALLADPSEAERRRFAAWQSQASTVVVHTDDGLYRRRGIRYPSEFDLVETVGGAHGYNAYLNRLSGLGARGVPPYQLAYNLHEEIDPARVVHVQRHMTPRYTAESFRYRDEVATTNGENRTFHAGAYLGDGLHEGAVRSAAAVARLLGGRELRF